MHDLASRRVAQFIVATHSPMLLALPGARVLSFDEAPITSVPYSATAHYQLTRDFMNDPARYFRHLLMEPVTRAEDEP